MDAGQLLREARWASGLSQRALAEAAHVSRRVVESAESGRLAPRADVLDGLLQACGRELVSRPVPVIAVDEDLLRAHLRLSLTRRIGVAAGGPRDGRYRGRSTRSWTALCRLAAVARGVLAIEGPLAYAAWVPGLEVAEGQPLALPSFRLGALARSAPFALDVELPPWSVELVAIRLPGTSRRRGGDLLVPSPLVLVDGAPAELAAVLSAAARLLHEGCARDAAGRRVPAHARPDEDARVDRMRDRYDPRTGTLPSVLDSPTWRLGAPGSMQEDICSRGLRPYPPKPGWSRWGWR